MKIKVVAFTSKIKRFIRDNRSETVILLIILLIAAFLRLYRIDDYMTFLGDEGRDAIIVRRLLVDFDPVLIGPGTSIGNMYLGPLYYYLIAPALLFANFSPVGPSILIALIGIATVFFVWFVSREWFGVTAAQAASFLYAISPTVIIYSKSSWNPNIMPFFALLCIYAVWRIWHSGNHIWLFVLGISYAFVLQSHYLGLLLAPTFGLFLLLAYNKIRGDKTLKPAFIKSSLAGMLIFLLLMSPLVIFDARHGWQNFSAVKKFFLERQTTVSARPWTALPELPGIITKSVTRLLTATDITLGRYVTILGGLLVFWFAFIRRQLDKTERKALFLLFVWLSVSYIGLGVYKQEIYDHYYGFFFPAPFIIYGFLIEKVNKNFSTNGKILSLAVLILISAASFSRSPIRGEPNHQMLRAEEVAETIKEKSHGEKFNLAVIAERNYEDGYQYFLEKWGEPVNDIDPLKLNETLADQLFVVCELPTEKCDPTHSPKTEIANFGWSTIDDIWEVAGVTVYKLIHTK